MLAAGHLSRSLVCRCDLAQAACPDTLPLGAVETIMFTLEIAGRPVAVLNLPTRGDAEDFLSDEEFREDLTMLQHEGQPLWDGEAELRLREATLDERTEFASAIAVEEPTEEDDAIEEEGEPGFVMFLVDVTDPDDPTDTGD
jgi:hypothetical protein